MIAVVCHWTGFKIMSKWFGTHCVKCILFVILILSFNLSKDNSGCMCLCVCMYDIHRLKNTYLFFEPFHVFPQQRKYLTAAAEK